MTTEAIVHEPSPPAVPALTYDEYSDLTARANAATYRRKVLESQLAAARGVEDATQASLEAYRARQVALPSYDSGAGMLDREATT